MITRTFAMVSMAALLFWMSGLYPRVVLASIPDPEPDCEIDDDDISWWNPTEWDDWMEFGKCVLGHFSDGSCTGGEIHKEDGNTHFHCDE